MTEAVHRSDKVVYRLLLGVLCHNLIQHRIIRIGKEDRLHIRIVHTHMLHPVLLLVPAGQLMLLDDPVQVVVHIGTDDQTILCLAVHGLCIDIIILLRVLNQPSLVLEELELTGSLRIHLRVVLVADRVEIDFRLDDVVERLLIALTLGLGLLAVQHVIGAALHLFHQVLRWAYSLEWFYYCHDIYSMKKIPQASL